MAGLGLFTRMASLKGQSVSYAVLGWGAMGMGARIRSMLMGIAGLLIGAWFMTVVTPKAPAPALNWPIVEVVKRVGPSVVVVVNNQVVGQKEQAKGMGSGVVMNSRGDIVTNYHVVQGADSLTVILSNNHRYKARVVGVDPSTDLAVIRIHSRDLVPVRFAPSANIEPGELVVAIGNSLGLTHTVTVGVISAKDRIMFRDGWQYHLIQTDAAINPGNSGGPLVNTHGELIGINSSKIAQTGVEGIGFAIPSDTVKYVVNQLLEFGRVRRPWIGATLVPTTQHALGMLVVSVTPKSPAALAGIKAGDLLTAINGEPVRRLRDVVQVLEKSSIGGSVRLGILRGDQQLSVVVVLQELPSQSGQKAAS